MGKRNLLFILFGGMLLLTSCNSALNKTDLYSEHTNLQSLKSDTFETSINTSTSISSKTETTINENVSVTLTVDDSSINAETFINDRADESYPSKQNIPDDWEEFIMGDLAIHLPTLEQTKSEEILIDETKLYEYFEGLEVSVDEWKSKNDSDVLFVVTHFKLVKGHEKNPSDGNFGQLIFLNYNYDETFDNIRMAGGHEFQVQNNEKKVTVQSLNAEKTTLWTYYMRPDGLEYWDVLVSAESSILSETLTTMKNSLRIKQ